MGAVVDELARRLRRGLDETPVVLWFDPASEWATAVESVADHLSLAGATLLRFDGSFLALRRAGDPHLDAGLRGATDAGRLVCWLPVSSAEAAGPLAELRGLGTVLEPGVNGDRNTRLAVVGRAVLKGRLPEDRLEEVRRQVEQGRLGLADLELLAESEGTGVVDLVFGTSVPEEVALRLLGDPGLDEAILAKGALTSVARLLHEAFGMPSGEVEEPTALREKMETWLLGGEYLLLLGDAAPAPFVGLPRPEGAAAGRVLALAARWRGDGRWRGAYPAAARRAETRLHIADHPVRDLALLTPIETFPTVARWQQEAAIARLLEGWDAEAAMTATRARTGFWAEIDPLAPEGHRWRPVEVAAVLLEVADRVEAALPSVASASEIARRYTAEPDPWCVLDEAQRRLEVAYAGHVPGDEPEGDPLEGLVRRARSRYRAVADALADRFVRLLAAEGFALAGFASQRTVFASSVEPALSTGRTAWVIVDALRYEMARDLARELDTRPEWTVELRPAMAAIPTLTPVGMAALMPGAETGMTLGLRGDDLVPGVGGVELKNRAARIKTIKARFGDRMQELKLDDLSPVEERVRQQILRHDLIVVTSTEIDEAGENVGAAQARKAMESTLDDLRRAINGLRGVERVVVVADHGFVFAGEPSEGEKIEPPGPKAHRRVWFGRGGSAGDAFVRFRARDVGLDGDLELAVPWNLGVFRAGGGAAYVHGGLSPQELLVPVLTLTRKSAAPARVDARLRWTITPSSARITTRLVMATIAGVAAELMPAPEQARVTPELRQGNTLLSELRFATAGFDDVGRPVTIPRRADDPLRMEEVQVALAIPADQQVGRGAASLVLLDADTGVEVARHDGIRVEISI